MNATKVMKSRRTIAATFRADKALAVAAGDYAELRRLMELTDDVMSGRHDVSEEIEAMSDDEILAALEA